MAQAGQTRPCRHRLFGDWLLLTPKLDWKIGDKTWRGGSLLAIDSRAYLAGARDFSPLFEPSDTVSLANQTATRDSLLLTTLDNVSSRLREWKVIDGHWQSRPVATPAFGASQRRRFRPRQPVLLQLHRLSDTADAGLGRGRQRSAPGAETAARLFDASPYRVQQWFATSRDGTRVPYFLISRKDLKLDRANPTLLYGYGGFEVSLTPRYNGALGKAWLERGGVYALANIRGGGEYGPAWHEAARKQRRQNAYDDFAAIAEDLAKRGVADARHLGIKGGSNGGLLMGVMLTQRPELFNAVVCQVPLLDMRRFNQLLAGASWMDEYGNPDLPEDWAYIRRYSPYHNLKPDTRYPATLFMTSTLDDRVHPGHARKMHAAMQAMAPMCATSSAPRADTEPRPTISRKPISRRWNTPFCYSSCAKTRLRSAARRGTLNALFKNGASQKNRLRPKRRQAVCVCSVGASIVAGFGPARIALGDEGAHAFNCSAPPIN